MSGARGVPRGGSGWQPFFPADSGNRLLPMPLMPAYSVQKLGNALGWGLVNDAPNALVWEIGHTGNYTTPAGQFCLPGSATKPPCYSYDVPTWLKFSPLKVLGVTFGDGSGPSNDSNRRRKRSRHAGSAAASSTGQPSTVSTSRMLRTKCSHGERLRVLLSSGGRVN